jgi:hypothetical protein
VDHEPGSEESIDKMACKFEISAESLDDRGFMAGGEFAKLRRSLLNHLDVKRALEPFESFVFVEKKHEGRKYADVKNAWSSTEYIRTNDMWMWRSHSGKPPVPGKI